MQIFLPAIIVIEKFLGVHYYDGSTGQHANCKVVGLRFSSGLIAAGRPTTSRVCSL